MADAKTIIDLASEMSRAFMVDTRANGDKFTRLRDGSPEWMQDVCRAAHDSAAMLPDDVRYEMIEDACDAIAEASEEDGDQEDFTDARSSMADGGSVYTNDQTAWLASRVDRYAYVDEAVEEFGAPEDGNHGRYRARHVPRAR